MRKLVSIFAAVLFTATVWAQNTPQKMSYQAVIRDGSSNLITSHAVGLRISILQGTSTGTLNYVETQTPTTNANGLISIEIGGGTGFDTINWTNGPYFIKTETDPTGGTNYTAIIGTSQLLSVPYALHAKTAESVIGNTHYIGERFGGGIVFFVYDNGQHGLIAAYDDQSAGIRWYGGSYATTRAKAIGIGAGLKNTAIIVANQASVDGADFAATVCNEYVVIDGEVTYGDWYLPSYYELNMLYLQKTIVGGFVNVHYWSSNEYLSGSALKINFTTGNYTQEPKSDTYAVRAIRAF